MIFYPQYFRDVGANPGILTQFNPCDVLRTADRENANVLQSYLDGGVHVGMTRKVVYHVPDTGVWRELELMLVEHGGSTDLTDIDSESVAALGEFSGKAAGRVYRLAGDLDSDADALGLCLGVMLGYHKAQGNGGRRYNSTDWAELDTIKVGDWFWVIRKGKVQLWATDNVVAGQGVVNDTEFGCTSSATPAVIDRLGTWLVTDNTAEAANTFVEAVVDFTLGASPST